MDSIIKAKNLVGKFLCHNIGQSTLIIVGSYLIGKEKIWISLAQHFNKKVWLEPLRLKAIKCIYKSTDDIFKLIVEEKAEALIHVLSMGAITYKVLLLFCINFFFY